MICNKIRGCEIKESHPIKVLKDRKGGKSIYRIENRSTSNFSIIDFENCVYEERQNDVKCDFGLKTDNSIYYVELKGSDVKNGITQLLETLAETEKCFKGLDKKIRLVATKFSKPNLVKKRREYKDLVKKVGLNNIVITQNIFTENI